MCCPALPSCQCAPGECMQGGVPEAESGCNIEALRSAVDRWRLIQDSQELQSLTVSASDIHCFCEPQFCVCVCVCLSVSLCKHGSDHYPALYRYVLSLGTDYTCSLISTQVLIEEHALFRVCCAGWSVNSYAVMLCLCVLSPPVDLAVECRGGFVANPPGDGMVGVKVTLRSVSTSLVVV